MPFQESPEERLFKAALGFAEEEREGFIRKSADGDDDLADAALLLLEGYRKMGGDGAEATMAAEVGSARQRWATSTEETGSVIGEFTLVRKIGEGGMGTVWEAQQSGSIERRVALKLIKLGMDTAEVVRRFERERKTLAGLAHPNIAAVYEAGATDLGRPFFIMELVEGEAITDYATRAELSVESRLELVQQVCAGIDYAHRKGVIHRDLKPSNVLVNAEGVPKIIDFGIAKAAADEGGTLFTQESQMLGTPAYMSPEQAAGDASAIDTRSDVYSLGVVLYELLSGAPPFDPDRLARTGIAEMQKILTEEEPPKPSTRRTATGSAPDSDLLTPHFDKDLDWIVMKAIAKEPERRYTGAAALAEDLQRYLDSEVVTAVPPSIGYRLSKFVQRRRVALLSAAAVLVAMVAGVILSRTLFGDPGFDAKGVITPMSVTSNIDQEGAPERLIDGSGLSETPSGENLHDVTHAFALAENSWVSLPQKPDFFAAQDEVPALDFELERPTEIAGFTYWGYVLIRFGPDFGHEPKTFRFTFFDGKGKPISDPVERTTDVPTRRAARVIALPRTKGVKRVRVEILDNHYPFPGGGRVAMGEARFLSSDAPPEAFDSIEVTSPLPPIFAARLKPSKELASELLIGHTPDQEFIAGDPPDFADTALTLNGEPLSQYRGVLIPSVALNGNNPTVVRASGELNNAPEAMFDPPFPAGVWLSTNVPKTNYEISRGEVALAYFPFAAGWSGMHFGKGLRQIRKGNAAASFEVLADQNSTAILRDPAGQCTPENGALFAVGTGNLTVPEVLSTRAVQGDDSSSGWAVSVTDAGSGKPTDISWSFAYVPFDTPDIAVGRIAADGKVLASNKAMPFTCEWQPKEARYRLAIDGLPNLAFGSLILTSCDTSESGRPRDCQFYWQLSDDESEFYVHPRTLPLSYTRREKSPCGFVFAYVPFGVEMDAEQLAARAEQRAVERAKTLAAQESKAPKALIENRVDASQLPDLAAPLAGATVVSPVAVTSSTAGGESPDIYSAVRLIDGSGLNIPHPGASVEEITHASSSGETTWVTTDNIPDYFRGPGALPVPELTFTLSEPTEISGFVQWAYRYRDDHPAEGNQPNKYRFTYYDKNGEPIGAPEVLDTVEPGGAHGRVLELLPTPEVMKIKLELLDNDVRLNGGDRLGLGEVRFLSDYRPDPEGDAIRAAAKDALAAATLLTPIAVETETRTYAEQITSDSLISGYGLNRNPELALDLLTTTHMSAASEPNSWVADFREGDYFGNADLPSPELVFVLPEPAEVSGVALWSYLYADDKHVPSRQPSRLRFTLYDDDGVSLGEPHEIKLAFPGRRQVRIDPLPPTPGVKRVKMEVLDNFSHLSGGNTVALGEVRFLSGFKP